MTCDKEVVPSGTSTALVQAAASLLWQLLKATAPLSYKVLAIIANRFSFVFNLKGLQLRSLVEMRETCLFLPRSELRLRHCMLSFPDVDARTPKAYDETACSLLETAYRHCARFMISRKLS